VKGNNPFVVSSDANQPKFNKSRSMFNYKLKAGYTDKNGNSNNDWA